MTHQPEPVSDLIAEARAEAARVGHLGVGAAKRQSARLTRLADALERMQGALKRIAALDDVKANKWLQDTGAWGRFDEPASVQVARTALTPPGSEGEGET